MRGIVVEEADEIGDDFGVGFAGEDAAFFNEPFFESGEIFDDAVMNDGNFAGVVAVRMSIFGGRPAVRGPAGMGNAESTGEGMIFEDFFQDGNSSNGPGHLNILGMNQGDPGRIITPVF
ncbi:MAG: hypothetical protein BWY71_01506 [Planctomycetes bacterium ADurb.Bin412]|nr:MAG: hypothetical protein BWY71_01506 [Planctomycetes bacterium ADurb.Bin412]